MKDKATVIAEILRTVEAREKEQASDSGEYPNYKQQFLHELEKRLANFGSSLSDDRSQLDWTTPRG